MISTTLMIHLGCVSGNKMVDMQLSNSKLINRATKMLMEALTISQEEASQLLKIHNNVRKAIKSYNNEQ